MKPVVRFTIKQAVLINVLFVILTVAGAFSLFSIPIENMPNVDIGKVFIHTNYYGASADDVEQLVTVKIEEALDGMEHVEYVQARSYRNFSSIEVKFIDDSDYRRLYDELRFRILNVIKDMPEGVDEPSFLYVDTHAWLPVIAINLVGDMPQRSLKLYADELKSLLLAIPHVRNVNISGEFDREFHVSIDPDRLRKYGVTFNQAATAIESAGAKIPTGRYRSRDMEYMLDAGKRFSSQDEVLDVIVRRDGDGNFIRVRDLVTNARLSHRDPYEIVSVNGRDTLRLVVIKEDQGNSLKISTAVKEVAGEFAERHGAAGLDMVFTMDSTIEINDSVKTLSGNLILGLILVMIVLWVTMGFRNAMLTAVGIPFAFLCSITIMWVSGLSLNTISLFAFVLVTGILVDDAVIIMENVFRHIQMGKSKVEAVVDGTAEVMLPVISSALTTAFAFLPMLIMTGSTGDFFAQIPKTVTYALCASLLEALFILPIHILDWGPKAMEARASGHHEDPFHHLQSGIFAPLWKVYHAILHRLLAYKGSALGAVAALFMISLLILVLSVAGIVPLIKVEFFQGNYFRYYVAIVMPPGTPIERTDEVVKDLSRFIMSQGKGQAESASGNAGFYEDEDYNRHTGGRYGQIVVTLPEDWERNFPENPTNDPMLHLDHVRSVVAGYLARRHQPVPQVKIFPQSDGPPQGKAVNIRVTAVTLQAAMEGTDRLMEFMRASPELADLVGMSDNRPDFHKTLKYTPRNEAVFEYDLMPGMVTAMVAGALNGYRAGKFRTVDEEVDLMVRLARTEDPVNPQDAGLRSPLDVLNLPVIEHSAAPVLLRDLVQVEHALEPSRKSRFKGRPTVTITADIRQGSKLSPTRVQYLVNQFYEQSAASMANVSLSFGGEFETTSKSYMSLAFAFIIAIMLIYMVLASQFNSYMQPVIIISAVPFAFIGVVMGLLITRTTFTIGSFMAVVGLSGIAVNNSLLLIEFINKRMASGKPLREAIIEGCASRMRPVLITTVTTLLGLLPMAIGIPQKSISWAPMATAFVTGLCSATLLTLLLIPVEYEFFHKLFSRFKKTAKEHHP